MKTKTAKNMFRLSVAVGLLLLLSGLFYQGYLETKQMEMTGAASAFRLASYVFYYLSIAAGAWLGWSVLVKIAEWVTPLLATQDTEITTDPPVPEEVRPIEQAMVKLTGLLAGLEPNVQNADARLMDAQQWTGVLVAQVLRVVDKIEEMEEQVRALAAAIEAINCGQRDKMAYAAGKVTDPAIRQLLRSPYVVRRPEFRADAITLISGEMGTLEQWGRAYGNFVTALFAQISQAKDKTAMLQAGRDMLEASRPVLLIQASLDEAGDALQLRAQPALRMMAREALPAPVTRLLQ